MLKLLPHNGIERIFEVKIEEAKDQQPLGIEPRTPDLSSQCSTTELQQQDSHHSSQLLAFHFLKTSKFSLVWG